MTVEPRLTQLLALVVVVARYLLVLMVMLYLPAPLIFGITVVLAGPVQVLTPIYCRVGLLPLAVAAAVCTIQVLVATLAPEALVALLVLAGVVVITVMQATDQQIVVAVVAAAQELRRLTIFLEAMVLEVE